MFDCRGIVHGPIVRLFAGLNYEYLSDNAKAPEFFFFFSSAEDVLAFCKEIQIKQNLQKALRGFFFAYTIAKINS